MQLFTKTIEDALKKYPYRSQDGKGKDALVIARFFGGFEDIGGSRTFTCYILEGSDDPDDPDLLYGLVSLGYGFEYGTIRRSELEYLRFPPYDTPLERDTSVAPLQCTLGQCMKQYKETFM